MSFKTERTTIKKKRGGGGGYQYTFKWGRGIVVYLGLGEGTRGQNSRLPR